MRTFSLNHDYNLLTLLSTSFAYSHWPAARMAACVRNCIFDRDFPLFRFKMARWTVSFLIDNFLFPMASAFWSSTSKTGTFLDLIFSISCFAANKLVRKNLVLLVSSWTFWWRSQFSALMNRSDARCFFIFASNSIEFWFRISTISFWRARIVASLFFILSSRLTIFLLNFASRPVVPVDSFRTRDVDFFTILVFCRT